MLDKNPVSTLLVIISIIFGVTVLAGIAELLGGRENIMTEWEMEIVAWIFKSIAFYLPLYLLSVFVVFVCLVLYHGYISAKDKKGYSYEFAWLIAFSWPYLLFVKVLIYTFSLVALMVIGVFSFFVYILPSALYKVGEYVATRPPIPNFSQAIFRGLIEFYLRFMVSRGRYKPHWRNDKFRQVLRRMGYKTNEAGHWVKPMRFSHIRTEKGTM